MKVEYNVNQEDHVHHTVHHQPRQVVLLGPEGNVIRHHDGGVEGQDEDDPVPGGLEGAVVEYDVRGSLGGLLLVLWENVRSQLESLLLREKILQL